MQAAGVLAHRGAKYRCNDARRLWDGNVEVMCVYVCVSEREARIERRRTGKTYVVPWAAPTEALDRALVDRVDRARWPLVRQGGASRAGVIDVHLDSRGGERQGQQESEELKLYDESCRYRTSPGNDNSGWGGREEQIGRALYIYHRA